MKTKSIIFVRSLMFIYALGMMQTVSLCQDIPPKLLHTEGMNDTTFTQNLHYCIYKMAEQYEYFYLVLPSCGEDLFKVPLDEYPKQYVDFLKKNASSFTFTNQKDTMTAYYNGDYFGYYLYDLFWKAPKDEYGNASIRPMSFFYDTEGFIMTIPDSIVQAFESKIRRALLSCHSLKFISHRNSNVDSDVNCQYVFFEYKVGEKVRLMDISANMIPSQKINRIYLRKIQRITDYYCKTYQYGMIRFSNIVCYMK